MTEYRSDPRLEPAYYRPAEDSRLLVDAATPLIDADATVVDVGTGSGFVADRIATRTGATVIGTDINPHACAAATAAGVPTVRASLCDAIASGRADAVVFNPPYLPSLDADADWLERAVGGGPTGAEVVLAWLDDLPRVLADGGVGVCVISSITGIDRVTRAAQAAGLAVRELQRRRWSFEELVVLALTPRRRR